MSEHEKNNMTLFVVMEYTYLCKIQVFQRNTADFTKLQTEKRILSQMVINITH